MNEVIREFILETQENLAQLDIDLVTLEKDPTERETLARIFRTFHTVKGTAGFLGLMKLQAVTHSAENLLSRLTAGELAFNAGIASALLITVDTIRKMLDSVERTEQEGEGDYSSLIQTLERLRTANVPRKQPLTKVPVFPAPAPKVEQAAPPPTPAPPPPAPAAPKVERVEPVLARAQVEAFPTAPSPRAAVNGTRDLEDSEPVLVDAGPDFALRNGTVSGAAPSPPLPTARVDAPERVIPEPVKQHASAVSETSIRVDVGLLDRLMNLVGELVLTRNQIVRFSESQDDAVYHGTIQRLNALTTDLQAGVMKTRMQPIGTIWSKFPRLVRDLAVACGKQITFEMEGRDTDLDKTIIEAIRDPLIHMIRNAVDHGIETPAERKKRGKPEEGRVTLNAFHEGGKVIIEVADDGAGIDPQRVRKKAITANLITAEQADHMSKRELLGLIFHPGFSTADKVTHFSGRGVGMNVVQTNLETIGGTIDIDTCVGLGTTFKIKIPLTLAIIPALTVFSAGDCYAIPQINLLELLRLEAESIARGIEYIHGAPVYRLRGNLLPLVYLNEQLGIQTARDKPSEANCSPLPLGEGLGVRAEPPVASPSPPAPLPKGEGGNLGHNIVVVQADDRPFGLIVDEIGDAQEIVVKPLQKHLKDINVFAGATIMGDGKVALILDVLGLAQRANVISNVRERVVAEKPSAAAESAEVRQTVILFASPGNRRMAVPLSQVARLEEFPRSALEKIGNQYVVLYRDDILPLIDVAEILRISHDDRHGTIDGIAWQKDDADTVQIVVHAWEGRLVGLVVGRILDIVEETPVSRSRVSQPCVLFSAVIQGRATEILDIDGIIHLANPEFYEEHEEVAEEV